MARCKNEDRYAATKIAILLQELRDDRVTAEELIQVGPAAPPLEDVEQIFSLQEKRINAYRAKIVDVAAWRIIAVGDHRNKRVGIFAIMNREQNYQDDPELWDRIERECDEYDFERY